MLPLILTLLLSTPRAEAAGEDDPEATEPAEATAAAQSDAAEDADEEKKKKFFRSDKDYVPDPNRTEWMVFPVIAQNPDVGAMVGLSGSVAKFKPDYDPYRWALRANAILSFREFRGRVSLLMQNYSLSLDMPDLAQGQVRILPVVQFLRIPNASYYGVGNAWEPPPSDDTTYYRYDRWLVQIIAPFEWRVTDVWKVMFAINYRYFDVNTYEGSLLEAHRELLDANGDPILPGSEHHNEVVNSITVKFDTRDYELDPVHGWLLQTSIRNTLGLASEAVGAYFGWNLDLRAYQGIVPQYLTLAGRFMSDVQWGDVPFYELDRAGAVPNSPAIGGSGAIRGIPEGRYRGQSKILGQVELRSWLFGHMLGNVRVRLGLEAFFDAGRVWAVTGQKIPELDGTGFGLKYGTGGGLRFGWGEYGVVRVDFAWSPFGPPGQTVGVYMDVMNAF